MELDSLAQIVVPGVLPRESPEELPLPAAIEEDDAGHEGAELDQHEEQQLEQQPVERDPCACSDCLYEREPIDDSGEALRRGGAAHGPGGLRLSSSRGAAGGIATGVAVRRRCLMA